MRDNLLNKKIHKNAQINNFGDNIWSRFNQRTGLEELPFSGCVSKYKFFSKFEDAEHSKCFVSSGGHI